MLVVLENSRCLTVTLTEQNSCRKIGFSFDEEVQQIEHEHDDKDELDSLNLGFWV